jgi:hypothetical protein
MPHPSVERSIEIDAPASAVWSVFTDPRLTRQLGGEYVTNWTIGGSFGWKGSGLGPSAGSAPATMSVITYRLRGDADRTILTGREDFTAPLDDSEHADATDGWEAALLAVKALAERQEYWK